MDGAILEGTAEIGETLASRFDDLQLDIEDPSLLLGHDGVGQIANFGRHVR